MWDFDGDSISDSIMLIGDHGAHVHFYPIIYLSAHQSTYSLKGFWLDMPYPEESKSALLGRAYEFHQLVIDDFNGDDRPEIYLKIDDLTYKSMGKEIPEDLKEKGVYFNRIVLTFSRDKMFIYSFEEGTSYDSLIHSFSKGSKRPFIIRHLKSNDHD